MLRLTEVDELYRDDPGVPCPHVHYHEGPAVQCLLCDGHRIPWGH